MAINAQLAGVFHRYKCWRCHRTWYVTFHPLARLLLYWEQTVADPERPHYLVGGDLRCPAPGCDARLWHGQPVAQTADGQWIRVPARDWMVS